MQPIRSYQVEMTKKLHLIIVSADFKTFMHEHPLQQPDGHLTLTQKFPAPGTYLLYADALPGQAESPGLSLSAYGWKLPVQVIESCRRRGWVCRSGLTRST